MPKTVDKYDKERLQVLHKIFNILGINENNNKFLLKRSWLGYSSDELSFLFLSFLLFPHLTSCLNTFFLHHFCIPFWVHRSQ